MRNVFDVGTDDDDMICERGNTRLHHHHLSSTNDDATECRYSMVKSGLFEDPFVEFFLPSKHFLPPKAPLINRGTFLRTASIDRIVSQQLESGPLQIVSFGAGFDTRFYRFQENCNMKAYVEVDFAHVVQEKSRLIIKHNLKSPTLIGADLEKDFESTVEPKLVSSLDPNIKTLFIFECILMYLSDEACNKILNSLRSIDNSTLVVFDPLFVGDRFGQVMESNLAQRGLLPQIFRKYPTLATQVDRFKSLGWASESVKTMAELGKEEEFAKIMREKVPLDEYEEWNLLTEHYYLMTAHN